MLLAALDQIARGGSDGPRFLFPLLLIILLGLLAAKLIRHRRGGSPGAHRMHGESPLRTLEDRFARGTIDRAEFDHRKAVLLGDDVIPPAPAEPMTPPSPPEDAPDPVTDDELAARQNRSAGRPVVARRLYSEEGCSCPNASWSSTMNERSDAWLPRT